MTAETEASECRHRKSPPCGDMIAGHTSWFKSLARCTKGIVHVINNDHVPRGITYGTNFRHAVEFSRSGRTPLQPFRSASGQPMKLYSVSFARSNRHCPHSRLVCGRGLAASLELGGCPAGPASSGSVRRTRRTLAPHPHVSKQGVPPTPGSASNDVESLCTKGF